MEQKILNYEVFNHQPDCDHNITQNAASASDIQIVCKKHIKYTVVDSDDNHSDTNTKYFHFHLLNPR